MSSSRLKSQTIEQLLELVELRIKKDIGAIIVAPGVIESQREQLFTKMEGKCSVIAVKGAALIEPGVLSKIEALYEVVTLETNTMKYFAPEALLRGLNNGFTPLLDSLKLNLSPVEGFFELISYMFPRGISGAILAAMIATECLGMDAFGLAQNLIVVATSTQTGNIDSIVVLRADKIQNIFFQKDQPLIKEIIAMPQT